MPLFYNKINLFTTQPVLRGLVRFFHLLCTALLIACNLAHAQVGPITVDPNFDPGVGMDNEVFSIVVQSDGKILVGGYFTDFNGVTRNRIARLNPNGTLDPLFNLGAGANNGITQIALQSDGKILIGGDFNQYDGVTRGSLERLNPNGSLDLSFNLGTGAAGGVNAIVVQSDGKILFGGNLVQFNGIPLSNIARLNADGTLDPSFSPVADYFVNSMALQSDGKILIGGEFTDVNGVTRNRIARLNPDGSLDPSFDPSAGPNANVRSIALQSDGKILISGQFINFDGVARNGIARLNPDGTLDPSFDPGTGASDVSTIKVQSDGNILIGGYFTDYNGVARNRIARLNPDGSLDPSFDPGTGADGNVYSMAIQSNGNLLVAGDFTQFDGVARNYIVRLIIPFASGSPVALPMLGISMLVVLASLLYLFGRRYRYKP